MGHCYMLETSDVKRGQNLEAETEAEARVLRPRVARDRGQSFEVKAEAEANFLRSRPKAEAKEKVMNKRYQMMVDNIQANLYHHYDQNDTVYFSFSLAQ